ncbi:MAG: hypothetical protein JW864_13345, partial [Spirochaetes bacterium]|nr:hypothetical protein [Spirochaetota bacterium]
MYIKFIFKMIPSFFLFFTIMSCNIFNTHNPEPEYHSELPQKDYTEKAGGVSFDMVYVPGGTFTIGCESGDCPADTKPVPGVRVSSYHIAKNQVTT